MLLRIDFKFSINQNGWKETYWMDRGGLTVESALPVVEGFAEQRSILLADNCALHEVSVANPLVRGHTAISTKVAQVGPGLGELGQDVADTAVMVRFSSQNRTASRVLWLRGFPDEYVIFTDGQSDFQDEARTLLTAFLTFALEMQLVIHGLSKLGPANAAPKILSVQPSPGGTRLSIRSPAHGLPGGSKVTISGCLFDPPLNPKQKVNGTHMVIPSGTGNPPADWFEINVAPGALRVADYKGGGTWQRRIDAITPISFAEAVKFGSRSTGRSPVMTRGRRPAKRRYLPIP